MSQIQLTSVPIVTIIVCVIMGINVLSGALKGFVRKISGLVAFILAGVLVTALLPTVTSWLHTTPVYSFIREQCETIGTNLVQGAITSALGGGTAGTGGSLVSGDGSTAGGGDVSSVIDAVTSNDGSGSLDRSKIKAQLQAMGYDPSIIDGMSDEQLESYAQQMVGSFAGMVQPAGLMSVSGSGSIALTLNERDAWADMFPALLTDSGAGTGTAYDSTAASASENGGDLLSQLTEGMDRVDQTKFIESLPLPQSIKDQMETFNNENGYQKLGATDFGSYIINYFASLIMNILAFVVTLLVSWLIIRLILGALSVFSRLPIVGTTDRLLGILLGFIQGLFIVWGLFLVLSMFATTEAGAGLMQEINNSSILSMLYNMNPFLKSAAGAIKGIM